MAASMIQQQCKNSKHIILCLLVVIAAQWFLLTHFLSLVQQQQQVLDALGHSNSGSLTGAAMSPSIPLDQRAAKEVVITRPLQQDSSSKEQSKKTNFKGVAACLLLRAPRWFHRRLTIMIEDVYINLPRDWVIQLFVEPHWWKNEVLPLHPGLSRFLARNDVVVVELPPRFRKMKPKQIMIQPWFWQQMQADHIFMFSGNGVMCRHSQVSLDDDLFVGLDFCGVPNYNKVGGDASTHSIRNRQAMLDAIEYAKPSLETIGPESRFFLSTLEKINQDAKWLQQHRPAGAPYRIATRNETILFGGGAEMVAQALRQEQEESNNNNGKKGSTPFKTQQLKIFPSLVLSGTGANLDWNVRDALFQVCPEWKLIFPSLHDPNCFGASPKAEKCAATICALQPNRPKQGC